MGTPPRTSDSSSRSRRGASAEHAPRSRFRRISSTASSPVPLVEGPAGAPRPRASRASPIALAAGRVPGRHRRRRVGGALQERHPPLAPLVLLLHEHRDVRAVRVRERGLDHEPVAVPGGRRGRRRRGRGLRRGRGDGLAAPLPPEERHRARRAECRSPTRKKLPLFVWRRFFSFALGHSPESQGSLDSRKRSPDGSHPLETKTDTSSDISFFSAGARQGATRPSAHRGHPRAGASSRTHARAPSARPESGRQVEVDRRRAFRAPRREG
jgi:hypothetical protein